MPVDFPVFEVDADPRDTLMQFLVALRRFLTEIVRENRDPNGEPILFEEFRSDARKAWGEANEHFDTVLKRIGDISDRHLFEHGLTGYQLRLKTGIVQFFAAGYQRAGKRLLKRLFEVIDDLLDSILDGVPGAGFVSEIKDAIKNCVSA